MDVRVELTRWESEVLRTLQFEAFGKKGEGASSSLSTVHCNSNVLGNKGEDVSSGMSATHY